MPADYLGVGGSLAGLFLAGPLFRSGFVRCALAGQACVWLLCGASFAMLRLRTASLYENPHQSKLKMCLKWHQNVRTVMSVRVLRGTTACGTATEK